MRESSSKRAKLFLFLTWTLGSVYCSPEKSHLSESHRNKIDTILEESEAPMSPIDYSVDCGRQNSNRPFEKVYPDPDYQGRIIGGTDAEPGEFPWQISLQVMLPGTLAPTYNHTCGGSIVSEDIVVTAGHCLYRRDAASLRIVAGADSIFKLTGNEQIRGIKSYISKFRIDQHIGANDIAVLILDEPLKFNSRVAPVCLPNADFAYDGDLAVVTGWGRLSDSGAADFPLNLQVVQLSIFSRDKCQEMWWRNDGRPNAIQECSLCAGSSVGGRDSCQGDSGGPMTCVEDDGRHYLCGIVSWGKNCGNAKFPGVYTETACFSSWITEQISIYNSTRTNIQ